jgi:hypothetical protein
VSLAVKVAAVVRHGQQVHVVVAQQAGGGFAQASQAAQHLQGLRAAVDQVTQHHDAVARRRKADRGQHLFERLRATLQVTDEMDHRAILLRLRPHSAASAIVWQRAWISRSSSFLILLNGLFALSEMALTASRKARLQVMVESREPGAQAAMDLHENPTKFLSTVQIGITSIGVLNGIVGEAAFSGPLARLAGARPGRGRPRRRRSAPPAWWWP